MGTDENTDFCAASPYESERSISAVMPAVSAAIGAPMASGAHRDPAACQRALRIPDARSVIIVLIDGLGYWNLRTAVSYAPYLRSLMHIDGEDGDQQLRTCYPTTTAAALSCFGTGETPGATGMLGYTQLNPETGRIAQMIQFRGAPADVQQRPTYFERFAAAGVRATSVGLPIFKKSPLTHASMRGGTYVSQKDPTKRAGLAAKFARQPGVTYLYMRDVDKAGHAYGWGSDEWLAALEAADLQLRMLRDEAGEGTEIIVIADHGMVNSDPAQRINIASVPELSADVRLVGGEPRAVMLYLDPGADPYAVAGRWQEYLGERARVLTRDQAIENGLYGKVEERIRPMIGDVIVACEQNTTIVDSRFESLASMTLPGVHGSWTVQESTIPLLIDMV